MLKITREWEMAMSIYVAEYDIDDFVDNCDCCEINRKILEGDDE
jgi:hypothetical protein